MPKKKSEPRESVASAPAEATPSAKPAKTEAKQEKPKETKKTGKTLKNAILHNGKPFEKGQELSDEDVKLIESIGLGDYIS